MRLDSNAHRNTTQCAPLVDLLIAVLHSLYSVQYTAIRAEKCDFKIRILTIYHDLRMVQMICD